MLEIVICEDNSEYLDIISRIIRDVIQNEGLDGRIVLTTDNPFETVDFLNCDRANVFFLDIDLNSEMNGYELSLKIRDIVKRPYIIFITEHMEYVLQAFKVRPFDFLPKPVTSDTIKKCLMDINRDYTECTANDKSGGDTLVIKSGPNLFHIKYRNIVYIEKLNNRSIIHTVNKDVSCYETLKSFEKKLMRDKSFVRCHKSFIANKNYFSEVHLDKKEIIFETGHVCDIGRKYRKRVMSL